MISRRLVLLVVLGFSIAACNAATIQPNVSFDDQGCASSDIANWPDGALDIEVSNSTPSLSAVIMGTYEDGFGHDDLVAYGSDISTRPEFIDALEIFQVAAGATTSLVFDYGPGTFFLVCMPDSDTMVVLDDVTIEN
jgi:hypothetical protein